MGRLYKNNYKLTAGKSPTPPDETGEVLLYPSAGGLASGDFIAGDNITLVSSGTGANEKLVISSTGGLASGDFIAGDNITLVSSGTGANERLVISSTTAAAVVVLGSGTSNGWEVASSQYYFGVSGSTSGNLISTPTIGQQHIIKDMAGTAGVSPIVVNGNGNTIDGAVTQTISSNYQSISLIFNGLEWSII